MDTSELESLLNELVQAVGQVMQSGEVLSDELQGTLAKTLELLVSRIDASKNLGDGPVKTPPIQQGMPSSNVEGFAYDDKNGRLYVRFLGDYPNRNGPVYAYEGVPDFMFKLFRAGAVTAKTTGSNKWGQWWQGKIPSLGAALHELIKTQGYPYQRVA